MKRNTQNQMKSGEKAPSTVKSEKISSVAVKAFLRPIVSAMVPQTNAPRAMPIRLAVPIQPASPGVSCQWWTAAESGCR